MWGTIILGFFGRGRGNCTFIQKISYFYVFLEKYHLSFSAQRKNIMFSEKIPSFQIIRERSYSSAIFLKIPSFRNIWKKCHIFKYFFGEKDHLSFSVQGVWSYFREKEISSFPKIKQRSCSSAIFWEGLSFQDVWKNKIRPFVLCKAPSKLFIVIMLPKMIKLSIASKFHLHTIQSRSQCPRAGR